MRSLGVPQSIQSPSPSSYSGGGRLIINADDWGQDRNTTDRILECATAKTLSSTSAMVFMEDSERAADIALECRLDTGLHLNLTGPFTASHCPPQLAEQQRAISRYLRKYALARACFHPGLARAFEYVVKAQIEEYGRLYRKEPDHIDGHHHQHLSANVLFNNLLPAGAFVRRNFTFEPGEKSLINRLYRRTMDGILARRNHIHDYLFMLPPVQPMDRLERIFQLAHWAAVELETHPANAEEHRFLASGEIFRWLGDLPIASCYAVPRS